MHDPDPSQENFAPAPDPGQIPTDDEPVEPHPLDQEPEQPSVDSGTPTAMGHLPVDEEISEAIDGAATDPGHGARKDTPGESEEVVQKSVSPRHKLEAWLAEMVRLNASDLILRAGGRPGCRIDGRIHFLPGRVPAAGALLEVLDGVVGTERMATWEKKGSAGS